MIKLTRLDQRVVAINPDHIAWVEATPDTTLCLLGDRKIIVRETVDEVVERFNLARAQVASVQGAIGAMAASIAVPQTGSYRPGHGRFSSRPPSSAGIRSRLGREGEE